MKYAVFQQAYAKSDPRTVIVFHSSYADIAPFIVAQAAELRADVELYDKTVPNAVTAGQNFMVAFQRCLDEGHWLVVSDMSQVEFTDWRSVGQKLSSVLPDAKHRLRAQFRLFAFIPEGVSLQLLAPSLLCQFAIQVDIHGSIASRSDVSPIFQGYSSIDTTSTAQLAQTERADLQYDRSNPYATQLEVQRRTWGDDDKLRSVMDPEYVDEIIFSVRDAMIHEQQSLKATKQKEPPTQQDSAISLTDAGESGESDWIYHHLLAWVVAQCPEADISALPEIAGEDIHLDNVVWQTQREICESGAWCGSNVAIKSIMKSFSEDYTEQTMKRFTREAARHFSLRHPNVLTLYGMSSNRMVMEPTPGTLEQALIKARYESRRWSVRQVLQMTQQVLRGLAYLATVMIHRDIACRSIIETSTGYKIGQFACSLPLKYTIVEANKSLVPIRWTSPEGLNGDFSPRSDVWSFGVMLWETVHYATVTPYMEEEFPAPNIIEGQTLLRPKECCTQLYNQIIAPCFTLDVDERPDAVQLLFGVERALSTWGSTMLDSVIPFPTDQLSFEEYNSRVK